MTTLISLAPDLLLLAASLCAAAYCMILSRRVAKLSSFDAGIGGAIAVLSAQVDDMKGALAQAKAGTDGAGHQLDALVRQARDISTELELMIAACHDFAETAIDVQAQGESGGVAAPTMGTTASAAPVSAPGRPGEATPATAALTAFEAPTPVPPVDAVAPLATQANALPAAIAKAERQEPIDNTVAALAPPSDTTTTTTSPEASTDAPPTGHFIFETRRPARDTADPDAPMFRHRNAAAQG